MAARTDRVFDTDWASAWSHMVRRRARQIRGRPADFWDRRSRAYAFATADEVDPLLLAVEPFLAAHKTLIDVGAGTGRLAAALSGRLEWLTLVEPSWGMRERIPDRGNLTLLACTWEEAEVVPADLVTCSHVLYMVEDAVGFVRKLEQSATERVFLALRDDQLRHPAELLWESLSGARRARQPQFWDAYNLLRSMGIHPQVEVSTTQSNHRYADMEEAVEDCRIRIGARWDQAVGRAWLARHLLVHPQGGLVLPGAPIHIGVAHWRPRA